MLRGIYTFAALFTLLQSSDTHAEFRGNLSAELRGFSDEQEVQSSLSVNPEWYWQSESKNQTVSLEIFTRYDDTDDSRSHADIRDLYWTFVSDANEVHVGARRIFWGVTESIHLVDVINQSDMVESIDGEDKLGQPMIQFSTARDWGTLDLFLLPYFRERTFASTDGRLSGPIKISDQALYESGAEQWHQDIALRYSNTFDVWDVGVSYFSGTNRDPKLIPVTNQDSFFLTPYYDQSSQISTDIQATIDAWLFKLEYVLKRDSIDTFSTAAGGFEYTFFNVKDSGADIGFLMEYQYDNRDLNVSIAQNDIFSGVRITLNDTQDSQFLAGTVHDMDDEEDLYFIEANRRFGDSWRASLDVRVFSGFAEKSGLDFLNRQDHATLAVEYYF